MTYFDEDITEVEGIVLRCFFPEGEETTINTIKNKCGYSYERVNTALKKLEKKKIVSSKKIGKTLVYKADYNNLYLKLSFYHYMTEKLIDFRNKHFIIWKALKKIEEGLLGMIILFGSYSKRNETKDSDIDLMIVSESKKERENAVYSIKSEYGLDIAPVFVKRTEFPKIKNENPILWMDLKNHALIFNGGDLFYYWMYQHENN